MKPSRQIIEWTPTQLETLKRLWNDEGLSSTEIAESLGFPGMRMAIIGKITLMRQSGEAVARAPSKPVKRRLEPHEDRNSIEGYQAMNPQRIVAARERAMQPRDEGLGEGKPVPVQRCMGTAARIDASDTGRPQGMLLARHRPCATPVLRPCHG